MTAAFTERDWDRIEQAGYTKFVGIPVAEASPRKRAKLRQKRQEQFSEAYRHFRDVMESEQPPASKEEAIRQIVGLFGKLLAVIFPQYALLISIIGFLWDVSTGAHSTISCVADGSSEGRA